MSKCLMWMVLLWVVESGWDEVKQVDGEIEKLLDRGGPPLQYEHIYDVVLPITFESSIIIGCSGLFPNNYPRQHYPVLLTDHRRYYSLYGDLVLDLDDGEVWLTTHIPTEHTYLAQLLHRTQSTFINIYQLLSYGRSPDTALEFMSLIEIDSSHGAVIAFITAIVRGDKVTLFGCDTGQILQYEWNNPKLKHVYTLPKPTNIHFLSLNLKILVYSDDYFLIINLNSLTPIQCVQPFYSTPILHIKGDYENYNQFYVHTEEYLYLYQHSNVECRPVNKYRVGVLTNFWPLGDMILFQHRSDHPTYTYYNIQNNTQHQLNLPQYNCPFYSPQRTQVERKMKGEYAIVRMCQLDTRTSVSSFMMRINEHYRSPYQYTYQKMRIPMIIICLAIIIYITTQKQQKTQAFSHEEVIKEVNQFLQHHK